MPVDGTPGHCAAIVCCSDASARKGYPSEALRTIHPLLSPVATKSNGAPEQRAPGAAEPAAIAAGTGMMVGLVVSAGMNIKSEAIDGSMETTLNNLVEQFVENAARFYKRQGWFERASGV